MKKNFQSFSQYIHSHNNKNINNNIPQIEANAEMYSKKREN